MAAPRNVTEMKRKARDAGSVYGLGRASCVYCGEWVRHRPGKSPEAQTSLLTIDHFIARSAGGPNSYGNRVPACQTCNKSKKDLDPVEYIRRLGSRAKLTVEQVERAKVRILAGEIAP